jgi:glycosyltransferase involved in cell wall biosynthesis
VRILWHSNAPWVPSGYGTQTAIWTERLKRAGHDVAISSFYGLQGASFEWNGIPVFPGETYTDDSYVGHYKFWKADVMISLMDVWALNPPLLKDLNVYAWFPVDTEPLGIQDTILLKQAPKVKPIAMSRHGYRMLKDANFEPLYVPHGIDTGIYKPTSPEERESIRKIGGISPKTFVIGMCAANKSKTRKAYSEQLQAFSVFRKDHPDSILLMHCLNNDEYCNDGVDLRVLCHRYGIADAVRFSEQYGYYSGRITPDMMARWFGHLDVLSMTSRAEGFGLPLVEAQACGTPVVTTAGSSMAELGMAGWRVEGTKDWHDGHKAFWVIPEVDGIVAAYEEAYMAMNNPQLRIGARTFAEKYSVDRVYNKFWRPVLANMDRNL